jgi:hypothetical protein
MRYYDIALRNAATGAVIMPSSLGYGQTGNSISSNLGDGTFNPASLRVLFDLPVYPGHIGDTKGYVQIYGLGLRDIGASFNLNPTGNPPVPQTNITISGGMSRPPGSQFALANPKLQGILVTGAIYQAFGAWEGTDQYLAFFIGPPTGTTNAPANFTFQWEAGETLQAAIARTLAIAMPGVAVTFKISSSLVLNWTETGYYSSFFSFAQMIKEITDGFPGIGSDYPGVSMAANGNGITVWDGTIPDSAETTVNLAFEQLVGQATWVAPGTLVAKLVLRGDLNVGSMVTFPAGLVTTTAQSFPAFRNQSTFTGRFFIQAMHHFADSRQPDAASWATAIQCVAEYQSSP